MKSKLTKKKVEIVCFIVFSIKRLYKELFVSSAACIPNE